METYKPAKDQKWDGKKLAVGNWFSEQSYYTIKNLSADGYHDYTIKKESGEETY